MYSFSMQQNYNSNYNYVCLQVAESLKAIFVSENLIVDSSIVLNKDANSFPYNLIDDLVKSLTLSVCNQ